MHKARQAKCERLLNRSLQSSVNFARSAVLALVVTSILMIGPGITNTQSFHYLRRRRRGFRSYNSM